MIVIYLLVCSKCYFMVIRQVRVDLERHEYHFRSIVDLYRTPYQNNYFGEIAFFCQANGEGIQLWIYVHP